MLQYRTAQVNPALGRTIAQPLGQNQVNPVVPPPTPDFLFTGYTGIPGLIEAALVLSVTAAGTWVGIRTARSKTENCALRAAGWTGGIGSALLGLLYVGGKSGLNVSLGLPAMRITPV